MSTTLLSPVDNTPSGKLLPAIEKLLRFRWQIWVNSFRHSKILNKVLIILGLVTLLGIAVVMFRLSCKPDNWILGENWGDSSPWLQGDQWDAAMNYPFRDALIHFVAQGDISASECLKRLKANYSLYVPQVSRQMMNLLSSHDTPRFLTLCGGNGKLARTYGKFLAHISVKDGKMGLSVRQLATGSDIRILSEHPTELRSVSFSRNGEYLYFRAGEAGKAGYFNLYQVPTLGGTPSRIVSDIDSPPAVSPDGRKMAFIRGNPTAQESALAGAAVSISTLFSDDLLRWFNQTLTTPEGIAMAKFSETILRVIPILVLMALAGFNGHSMYLKTGKVRLWLPIAVAAWVFFPAFAYLSLSSSQTGVLDKLLPLWPWILLLCFVMGLWRNYFIEEYSSNNTNLSSVKAYRFF